MERKIKLNFQSSTSDANNLLVCLHGNSTDSDYFSNLLNGINGWRVVAPDFAGHGNSPRLEPSDYNYSLFIQSLVDFIHQFSYDRLVIIGHSMGGNLAIQLLETIEADGLLLLAAPPVSYSRDFVPYLKLLDSKIVDEHKEDGKNLNDYLTEVTADKQTANYLSQTFLNTDPIFRDRLLEEFGAMKFSDELKLLEKNESVLTGCILSSQDVVANNEYLNQLENENTFDYFGSISDSGHYSLLEKPQENKDAILTFLESVL